MTVGMEKSLMVMDELSVMQKFLYLFFQLADANGSRAFACC